MQNKEEKRNKIFTYPSDRRQRWREWITLKRKNPLNRCKFQYSSSDFFEPFFPILFLGNCYLYVYIFFLLVWLSLFGFHAIWILINFKRLFSQSFHNRSERKNLISIKNIQRFSHISNDICFPLFFNISFEILNMLLGSISDFFLRIFLYFCCDYKMWHLFQFTLN